MEIEEREVVVAGDVDASRSTICIQGGRVSGHCCAGRMGVGSCVFLRVEKSDVQRLERD